MRASCLLLAAALLLPAVAYAQLDGPVGGKVGPNLENSAPGRSNLSGSLSGRTFSGPAGGSGGVVSPGQVVPDSVSVVPRSGGMGSANVNGHQVIVDPNTNRIMRVIN